MSYQARSAARGVRFWENGIPKPDENVSTEQRKRNLTKYRQISLIFNQVYLLICKTDLTLNRYKSTIIFRLR